MKSLEWKATFVSTLVASSSPGYGVASTSSSVMADQAFVTLVTNDSYARGAMVLGMSLRNHKTSKKLVILVTQVSEPYLSVLRRIYDEVRVVDTLDSGDTAHLAMMKRPELGVTLTKLHCWTLTHYSKCVFMDADTMVLSNIDELFDREELSAAPDPGWPDCFNSGVFVYRPSLKTYGKLLQYCTEHGSFDGGDQGILNGFFSSWATADISKHLPFIYNLSSIAIYTYLPAFKQYGSNAKVVHFLGKTKPWSYTYDPKAKQIRGSVHEATAHPTFLQDWWTLYSSAVMPMLQKQQGDKPFQPFFGCMEVKGKAVFITGCDSGFGNALAKHMHKMGFTVFAGCLLKDKGGKGAKELEEFHSDRMKVVQLDVCSEEQVNQAVEYIKDNLEDSERGLWAVVNNAGMSTFGEVEFTSIDSYKQVSEVNLWGVIRVTKAVLPLIRRAKGRIVNMSSMYGRMGNIMRSPYCVSKYGVEAFSDCLRYEMKAWGVKVSVIEPGNFIVATDILTRDTVAATANKLWNEAPSVVKEDYGKAHFEHHMALMRSYCSTGQKDMAPVLDDITDAIVSKRPYTRYNPMEPHWWIRVQLMTHLPGAISDLLYF